jgi:Uma2 family endonuclease
MSAGVHMSEFAGNRNAPGPLTLADFEALPEDDNYRTELSRGWLMREPRPGGEHGCVSGNLHYLLRSFVSAHGLGRVLIETGFRISEKPPTVRGPDVAFIATSRLPAEVPIGFWTLAPDLAIEVVSPSDRPNDIGLKVVDYLEAGTAEIWVVQPRSRTVVVHRATGDARIVREGETLASELLPGLELSLKDVFDS